MTIGEIIQESFHYALTCRSLWLFGFVVGIASGGSNGGGRGGGAGGVAGVAISGGGPDLSVPSMALIGAAVVLALIVVFVLRFVGEGALIAGVVRARGGGSITTREGFRAGWAHWGVLVRIALLYLAAMVASVAALVVPCLMAVRAIGAAGGVLLGVPAVAIAVPWLVTLSLVQAFATRIAVLEHRHALDAIGKARLFLHGRLAHGLRLVAAALAGTFVLVAIGAVVIVPLALLLVALIPVLRLAPVIVLACLVLVPIFCLFTAIVGTFRSAVWTIGYVTQVKA